ncbi:MAG: RagB/SusD family nutrient uptake outer membrane protein [Cyclobacteriaceae bacterium]|jgi:hypothetical protein
MKLLNIFKIFLLSVAVLLFASGCEEQLKEEPFDQLSPANTLSTEVGLEALLVSAYGNMQWHRFSLVQAHYLEEGPTDLFFETGGGQGRQAALIQDFNFDSEHPWIEGVYNQLWNPIRDVNLFLENVEAVEFERTDRLVRIGEARFIRALQYYWLTKWFGEVPLITSPSDELYPEKESLSALNEFIATELRAAADVLPTEQMEYRITKGAALAMLTKHYLNTKQWPECASTAQELMDLQLYSLYPSYPDMFAPENELNSEFIFVYPQSRIGGGLGTEWLSLSLPPGSTIPGANFAAQFRYYDNFINSFDLDDARRTMFLTVHENINGETVQLLGDDNTRSLKFFDAERVGPDAENDFPVVRYADILLSRAEALNELNGPTQEAVDLINEVRVRAGVAPLSLAGFNQATLRNHLLKERGWEFYSEAKRRSDLIRHEIFISNAQERGKGAQPHQVLYPLPQTELTANPNLVQNDGYSR